MSNYSSTLEANIVEICKWMMTSMRLLLLSSFVTMRSHELIQ